MDSPKVNRQITWFDKDDRIKGELNINEIPLSDLVSIFSPQKDDPLMYNPYTIKKKHIGKLRKYVNLEFDFGQYVYQVDCFQAD
jgi:hypothetical protein